MPRPLSNRTIAVSAAVVVLSALVIVVETYLWNNRSYYLTSLIIILLAMLPFFMHFERKKPQVKEIVLLAVMTALAVAGRAAFYWAPQFKPVCAIVILTAAAFNAQAGFITGAASALISNIFFGQGPWTPWQMLGFGLVGFFAGILFYDREVKTVPLLAYGFFSVLIIYGLLLDTASLLIYSQDISINALLAMYASGFVFNLIHATATLVFLLLLKKPILSKLSRIKTKYGLLR
jgi:energy-coupling factor transport system substrate-specific component